MHRRPNGVPNAAAALGAPNAAGLSPRAARTKRAALQLLASECSAADGATAKASAIARDVGGRSEATFRRVLNKASGVRRLRGDELATGDPSSTLTLSSSIRLVIKTDQNR